MQTILKVSDAAALGIHAAAFLAASRERRVPAADIAAALDASVNHLSKVMQRLGRAGLVEGTRGPSGGFNLTDAGREATLLDVYRAIEGPLVTTDCLMHSPVCRGRRCIFGGLIARINDEVKEHLAETRLTELTTLFGGKT